MKKLLFFLFISLIFISLIFTSASWAAEAVPNVHSTAWESTHIVTTNNTKSLYWVTITWNYDARDRWLIVYDSKTIPVDGPLDTTKVLYCAVVSTEDQPSMGNKSFDWTNHPLYRGLNGIVIIVSTDVDGCLTKTADDPHDWITAGFN